MTQPDADKSRRNFLLGAGVAVAAPLALAGEPATTGSASADGTPEQIHLTWGDDPAQTVVVSWASPAQAVNPHVVLERGSSSSRKIPAVQRTYTDGLNGQTVFTYHARIDGLTADSAYRYSVTANNDRRARMPFASSFRTAPRGRVAFRWTSYGDLATPAASWTLSSPQSRCAVDAVERFRPLFHLLNRSEERR